MREHLEMRTSARIAPNLAARGRILAELARPHKRQLRPNSSLCHSAHIILLTHNTLRYSLRPLSGMLCFM
jgi:hypothetical protein